MSRDLTRVPVAAIGASAGGLAAFTELLQHLDATTGLALVLVQHLDATHESLLSEALQRATAMTVVTAGNGTVIEPDHVYVIPPNSLLGVAAGRLVVEPRSQLPLNLPIDHFFRSLAEDNGQLSIGVILSGNASDGTAGLHAIKEAGGITLAQDPSTAKFPSMPSSAIQAGIVDSVLTIPAIADELARLSRHPYLRSSDAPENDQTSSWDAIFALVREECGIDFSEYKRATLGRRLARRMALRKTNNLPDYLALLRTTPAEVTALSRDSLIHVTAFFRDDDAFVSLQEQVLPTILASKRDGASLRIWVPGCSTGEEVYSLAITVAEVLRGSPRSVQIFGSDVSASALRTARAGLYEQAALQSLHDDRRSSYFTKTTQGYRISERIREQCVFVQHDVTRDPPFSKLDLISCRNLMIYFDAGLQQRVAARFHFALRDPGFLLLGRNEAMDGSKQLFRPLDKANKIFERNSEVKTPRLGSANAARFDLPFGESGRDRISSDNLRQESLGKTVDRMLSSRYAPPGVVVNEALDVLQFRGQTSTFLQQPPGAPETNLLQMAFSGLSLPLRAGVARASKDGATVRTEGVEVTDRGTKRVCDLVFIPLPLTSGQGRRRLFLIVFEEHVANPRKVEPSGAAPSLGGSTTRELQLEEELASVKDYLQSLTNEHALSSEHLESTNEELISSNEELQSINEELGTAKEELQSINEELTTVNDELHERNREVTQANSDLMNLLTAVDLPMIILDREHMIRHFTPRARRIANVLVSDIGRPFGDMKSNVEAPRLDAMIVDAIESAQVSEAEVQDRDGAWHRLQVRPYRTLEGRIDGAIVSLFDIDVLKRSLADSRRANDVARVATGAKNELLFNLSHELRTPLTSMLLRAQLLRRSLLEAPAHVGRSAEELEAGILEQLRLVEGLLDVARSEAGSFPLLRQAVSLEQVTRAALDVLVPALEHKAQKLELQLDPTVSVIGDASRLQQVVANLLANAIEFTPERGSIHVSLSHAAGRAVLRVQDDGVGIRAESMPHIFERSTHAERSTGSHHGLGIGLAVVRQLVELHGGSVEAESGGPGRGAAFTISLPLQGDAQS